MPRDPHAHEPPQVTWLRDAQEPHVLLIGGASGTGKSSVAREVARLLGVHHLVPTDVIRRSLRTAISAEQDAPLHHESFDIPAPAGARLVHGVYVGGFEQQAATVRRALEAVLEHAALEGWHTVAEGVHLVPAPSSAARTQVLLAALDEERHRYFFRQRGESSRGGRAAAHYLANFARLRVIQDWLVAQAHAHRVPVIDTTACGHEDVVQAVIRELPAADPLPG